jgi:2-methylcitrate dehydratase PrpD
VHDVARVEVSCHPLVTELTGNSHPTDGLEAKFSTVHGVASGLRDGQVGLAQYADDAVRSPALSTLRDKIVLVVDPAIARDQATATVTTVDGSTITERVVHARGSRERPLSDDELLAKVTALVDPVLPGRAAAIASAVSELPASPTLAALVRSLTPAGGPGASHG